MLQAPVVARGGADDLLAVVEAAYRLDVTDADWLGGIATGCLPLLDKGFGLCAFEFHYALGGLPEILQDKHIGMPEELRKVYPIVFRSMPPEIRVRPFAQGPCTTGSQMMGQHGEFRKNELMQRFAQKFGMFDSIWITAAEPSGWGCGLHAGRAEVGWASRATVDRWGKIAAHLSAGARLRRRFRREDLSKTAHADADAVFSPNGRLHHAEGLAKQPDAIEQLRHAVSELENARGRLRKQDPTASLNGWKGLVDARWSLLDRFETDGKRYVVARENAPLPPGHDSLSLRERQILAYAVLGHENKVIAYDLGIAHSTVRVLLARAASKLGVASRAELIAVYLSKCAETLVPGQENQTELSQSKARD